MKTPALPAIVLLFFIIQWSAAAQEAAPPPADAGEAAPVAVAEAEVTEAPAAPAEERGTGAALIDKLILGGWTVAVQLIISVAGVAFAVERFINLRRSKIVPPGVAERADQFWKERKYDELNELLERRPSTLSRMIAALWENRRAGAADASTVAADVGARELKLHLQKAYPIAVVATIEPLLGLFGTVWGMIGAFDKVAMMGEMGNASALSSEIALALVTTAVGLAIAIPMLILYHYFKSRTALFGIALEEQVSRLVTHRILRTGEAAGDPASPAASTAAPAAEVARAH